MPALTWIGATAGLDLHPSACRLVARAEAVWVERSLTGFGHDASWHRFSERPPLPESAAGRRIVVLASGHPLAGARAAFWREWPPGRSAAVSVDPYVALAVAGGGGPWLTPHRPYRVHGGQLVADQPPAKGPLAGMDVLITRPLDQSWRLGAALARLGARRLYCPLWRYAAPSTQEAEDDWTRAGPWQAVLVTSQEAARRSADQIRLAGPGLVAAVGETTRAALRRRGVQVQVVGTGGGVSLVEALGPHLTQGARVAVLRAEGAPGTLPEALLARGWSVREVATHRLATVPESGLGGLSQVVALSENPWALVLNGRTAAVLAQVLDSPGRERLKLAVIGPETAKAAREWGLRVAIQADRPSWHRLLQQLADVGGCT